MARVMAGNRRPARQHEMLSQLGRAPTIRDLDQVVPACACAWGVRQTAAVLKAGRGLGCVNSLANGPPAHARAARAHAQLERPNPPYAWVDKQGATALAQTAAASQIRPGRCNAKRITGEAAQLEVAG